jgi:hypothetical protein
LDSDVVTFFFEKPGLALRMAQALCSPFGKDFLLACPLPSLNQPLARELPRYDHLGREAGEFVAETAESLGKDLAAVIMSSTARTANPHVGIVGVSMEVGVVGGGLPKSTVA